jgi:peptidylprolyl isomerase
VPKIISVFALASLVVLPLVACSSPAEPECTAVPSGPHSSDVKVTGALGTQPKVILPSPFDAKTTERTVAIEGSGERVTPGEVATVHYAAFNAATGATLELSPGSTWSETKFIVDKDKSFPGIYKSLNCSRVGDRIVSAVPPAELFGGMGVDMSTKGIGPSDTVVFVFDIASVAPEPSASPTPSNSPSPAPSTTPEPLPSTQSWKTGVPSVDLSGDEPVVTLPNGDMPTKLLVKVLAKGTGATVTAKSTVVADYQGTSWNTRKVFGQSYGTGTPATFTMAGLIQGFAAAMVGHKAGTTVLVTIPPKYAYGEGAINDQNLVGQTLLFVIHIISVS